MKIGKFAKKHEVTLDTVRFYIEKGLLVPSKKDSQYYFNEIDSANLEKIKKLKELGFSLSEIQRIFSFQRIGGTSTEVSRRLFLSLLEEKKGQVSQEIERLNSIHESLSKSIEKLLKEEESHKEVTGVPLGSLNMLRCPSCSKPLNISQGYIENNMVIDSEVHCSCGYMGEIREGIFIDPRAIRTKLMDGRPIPSKEEYLETASLENINYLHKGMTKLIELLMDYHQGAEYIMELSNCVGFFLLQYISYLPEDVVYIMADYDLERIKQTKRNLERYYKHRKFIFICCDIHSLPIKKASIDIVIDYNMTKYYKAEKNQWLIEIIKPYLKERGILGGIYSYNYSQQNRDKKRENDERDSFTRGDILETIYSHGIEEINQTDIVSDKATANPQFAFAGRKRSP
ncbi:MerR family transcriptional regulator [Alloiococcus sp. CFN-8]|uniref:MerR family transcriptional regulator n=1 Tax=Alloiococcus sp. CFN-8 TaxID=3416081 RepID=UPI003CF01325